MRVVSLVPSVTETLLAWGVDVVACTRFCEQPGLRHVGGTKDPAVAEIVSIRPDVVVVDDEENRREDADALVAAGLRVHVTRVRGVDDVHPVLVAMADAVGVAPPAPWDLPGPPPGPPRRAFVPIWRRPWMSLAADTYGASVLGRCGLVSVVADAVERYPTVTLDEVAERGCDVVLLPSEPYPFAARHVAEVADVLGVPVHLVDGQDLFWWGVRTPAAIDRLRGALVGPA